MNMMKFLTFVIFLINPLISFAHGDESRVALEPEMMAVQAGKVHYQFQLVDTKSNSLVTDNDLDITHEKKLHFFIFDPALKEFQHVHPEFDGKLWNVELNFSVNGDYWVWAQAELAIDKEEFTSSNRIKVTGGTSAWPTPPVLGDIRMGTSGVSKVELSKTKLVAGKMVMLMIKFSRTDGSVPQIEPYLGAFAHIVAVPDDADSLIHVHPMNDDNPNQGMIHATFPRAGDYRIWIQFIDGGNLKVIPLSVKVF